MEGTKNEIHRGVHYFILHSGEDFIIVGDDSFNGEYNNVAVLMCQQYMDQFPDFYSEFEKTVFPEYIVSNFNL